MLLWSLNTCYVRCKSLPAHVFINRRGNAFVAEEKWLTEAKVRAKEEAEWFVENMQDIAEFEDIDKEWFLEEVIKNIHKIKNNQGG